DLRVALSAPSITASQLMLGIAAAPGDASGMCFDMSRLGVYLANQIAITQMRFPTSTQGAAGGAVMLTEISPVGQCTMQVATSAGQSGEQIAAAVAGAFQAPGTTSPRTCPEGNNPQDIVKDGDSIVAVLPTTVRACILDAGVGFTFGPHGIDINPVKLKYEYAAKIVCGVQKDTKDMRLARGFYATSINIRNAAATPTTVFKTLALAYPPVEQAPGKVMDIGTDRLRRGEALKTDCNDIAHRLFPRGLPTPYIEGYVVVQSSDHLDVTGVYSTATLNAESSAEQHSSIQVQPIGERDIGRERPVPSEPPSKPKREEALLCYAVKASGDAHALVDIRSELALHRRVPLSRMSLLCEPVFKAHDQAQLPKDPPAQLPLDCYAIDGDPVNARLNLADRNGFFSGMTSAGKPELFCDPVKALEPRPSNTQPPYAVHLTGYALTPNQLSPPATVFARDRFGAHKLTLFKNAVLLEPATKNQPGVALPSASPLDCYLVEGEAPMDNIFSVGDQFGKHEIRVGAPRLFCDPTERTVRSVSQGAR
ncbi:MAG TPA: hypothetical protein VFB54_12210, partial [Burkholderiales bacterium]|nr:hypothetical protein [Burkholderiales bacterium]